MLTMTADIKDSISKIEELREYEKMVNEIRAMHNDAADRCTEALDAGHGAAAIEWFVFMEKCEEQISSITEHIRSMY